MANSKQAVMMTVLLEGSPISTEELCQSDHLVLGHLPDQGSSPPDSYVGRVASSRKSPGGFKLLPFKIDVGYCVLQDLQCCRIVFYPSPNLCLGD